MYLIRVCRVFVCNIRETNPYIVQLKRVKIIMKKGEIH